MTSYEQLDLYQASQFWNEGKSLELIDPTILYVWCPPFEVLRCIHVGLLYLQDQAKDRPTMLDVVSLLSNETLNYLLQNNLLFLRTKLFLNVSGQTVSMRLMICWIFNYGYTPMPNFIYLSSCCKQWKEWSMLGWVFCPKCPNSIVIGNGYVNSIFT